jgi:hypothetical protein
MNRFRTLGFISYNGRIEVHKSLLNVVLLDQLPEHNARKPLIQVPLQAAVPTVVNDKRKPSSRLRRGPTAEHKKTRPRGVPGTRT